MTYVRDQTPEELRAHMKRLQAMSGWHDPLADRLYEEVQKLERDVQAARLIAPGTDQWQPISSAPDNVLVVVFWLDSEDEKNPERYDFDYIEEGGWVKWNDHYEWAHSVALAGSRLPREQPPYTHWKALGLPGRNVDQSVGPKS
ncbi:hypothetical protein [Burkholderia sp. BCC1972]|uniref:hypothetical protein n=1 Tax=Burkholderia sp. BCC1972 TaxID=2817438 RepID=UPI002ABE65CE|nr:hypothetical protein [Burkholderia sp. BCC1972]